MRPAKVTAAGPHWPPAPAAAEPWTLSAAYERCRRLHARHGRTYYLATRLLPGWKRRHVHALYGFTRYADELVDDRGSGLDRAGRAAALRGFGDRFFAGLAGAPVTEDPVLPAVVHTVRAFALDPGDFERFLAAMAADLHVDGYGTYQELCGYMEGSAAAIGTMLTPILESTDLAAARTYARQLGLAFQLTNFLRDITEDLARGRVYLPSEDLARFGVTRADLAAPRASPAVQALVAFEIARARAHDRAAAPGIGLLAPPPGPVSGSPPSCMAPSWRNSKRRRRGALSPAPEAAQVAAGHDAVRRDDRGQEGPLEPRRLQTHPVALDDPGPPRDRLVKLPAPDPVHCQPALAPGRRQVPGRPQHQQPARFEALHGEPAVGLRGTVGHLVTNGQSLVLGQNPIGAGAVGREQQPVDPSRRCTSRPVPSPSAPATATPPPPGLRW